MTFKRTMLLFFSIIFAIHVMIVFFCSTFLLELHPVGVRFARGRRRRLGFRSEKISQFPSLHWNGVVFAPASKFSGTSSRWNIKHRRAYVHR